MTLAVAWTRKIKDCNELVVASDSRLSGGRNMDFCQKIILPPRSDCFICCAGDTQFTYPLAHLVSNAIGDFEKARDRSEDIHNLKGHVCRVLTESMAHIFSPLPGEDRPQKGTEFLFGGWSWEDLRFRLWRLIYNHNGGGFVALDAPKWFGHAQIVFAGDLASKARSDLHVRLHEKHGKWPNQSKAPSIGLDWEPFELLRDYLRAGRDNDHRSIGGPPQVAKIYQHQNCRRLGIYWPRRIGGKLTISGRTALSYETPNIWALDPDTLVTSNPGLSRSAQKLADQDLEDLNGQQALP